MVLVNTSKGDEMLKQIPNVIFKSRFLEEVTNGNDTLKKPTVKPEKYNDLFQICERRPQYKRNQNNG